MVARRAHNPKVVGSNPAPATIQKGQIAQSVEQRTENPCVGSSILPLATNNFYCAFFFNIKLKKSPRRLILFPVANFYFTVA